ncbi:MAG TPA: hypothetical protein VFS21_28175 [Roseiflexaceae bacterium]|nr:hypothetical protein [Roseiflexaceae bacterium]
MARPRDARPGGQPARHEITVAQALERLRAQGRLPQEPPQEQAQQETKQPQARTDQGRG